MAWAVSRGRAVLQKLLSNLSIACASIHTGAQGYARIEACKHTNVQTYFQLGSMHTGGGEGPPERRGTVRAPLRASPLASAAALTATGLSITSSPNGSQITSPNSSQVLFGSTSFGVPMVRVSRRSALLHHVALDLSWNSAAG